MSNRAPLQLGAFVVRAFTSGLGVLSLGVVLGSSDAEAALATGAFRIDKVEKTPTIDGLPSEWPRDLGKLVAVKGAPSASDLSAKAAVTYDDKAFYVAVDVTDDVLRGGGDGDKVEWIVEIGGTSTTVVLAPGSPGKSAGKATIKGAAVKDAKVVEAPRKGGWSLEASIPFAAIAGASTTRVAMKGGVFVHDADGSSTVEAIVGTTSKTDALSPLLTTAEQSLVDGLVKDKKLGEPSFDLVANVTGDALAERVTVFSQHLAVVGPGFRKGTEFYWNDMAVAGSSMTVDRVLAKDLDGDGKDELVFVKRFTKSGQKTKRDVLQVMSFAGGDTAEVVFQHEVGIETAKGSIKNDFTFSIDGGKPSLVIKPGTAKGLEEKSYEEAMEASFDPLLLPWGTIDSQTYKWKGKTLTKVSEKTHAKPASEPAKPIEGKAPPPEKATPKPKEDNSDKVLELFKKDRKVTGAPKHDLRADCAEGSEAERVVVFGRDLAVLGPGFKGGTSYVFTTLPFAAAGDLKSVAVKDVTGDGKAEIVVRGILKAKGPNKEDVDREIEFVYRVSGDGVKRVFAAEVSRTIGKQSIVGSIAYTSAKSDRRVVLSAGKAIGFTKETYPFNQDAGAVSGIEPLLLPWSEKKELRYKWTGSAFERD
jgi:hypothetical protein